MGIVAVFGKAAETAANLKKGDRVYVEGSIKLDAWRGNDGMSSTVSVLRHSNASARITLAATSPTRRPWTRRCRTAQAPPRESRPVFDDEIGF